MLRMEGWDGGELGLVGPCVCVLGSPALRHAGREVAVTGMAGRVLAALVARRHGLRFEELSEVVWPDGPPPTARSALHVHLSSLRKTLAAIPGAPEVRRTASSYQLELNGWQVDVDIALVLGTQASGIAPASAARAAQLLDAAIQLWRGPAFTVDGHSVDELLTHRYELRRLDLEEDRVDALVAAGDLSRAEDIALELVESEPYRERRWCQLVTVQARRGHPGDALDTHARVRQLLLDDLGVEPGDELQVLHHAVVTRDPSLLCSTPHRTDAELEPPPVPVGCLIGRADELARIESALASGAPVTVLGAPGVGKTRLVLELASRARVAGQAVGWVEVQDACPDLQEAVGSVERWIRQHPGGLLIVDGAEAALDLAGRVVATARRFGAEAAVVVTSRLPVPIDGSIELLDPLRLPACDEPATVEAATSVVLLRSLCSSLAPRVALHTADAAAIVRRAGGLPLGIRIAAGLSRSMPPSELATHAWGPVSGGFHDAVCSVVSTLEPDEQAGFAALSVVSGRIDAELAGALTGQSPARVRRTLSRLVDHGLIQVDGEGGRAPYSMLEPLREVGTATLDDACESAVLARLATHCVERAKAYERPTLTTQGERLVSVVARELPWHRQALEHLVAAGDDGAALQLVAALDLPLYAIGWWRIKNDLQDLALSIPGAPSAVRGRVHAIRGRAGSLHEFDEEHLTTALEIASRVGDVATEASASLFIGILRWWQGRLPEALDALDRSRRLAEINGESFTASEARKFTGVVLVSAGDLDHGFTMLRDLVEKLERKPALAVNAAHARTYLGHCRRHVGDLDAAVADLQIAMRTWDELENTATSVHVCAGLAELHADRGDHHGALHLAGRSLQLAAGAGGGVRVHVPWVLCVVARAHLARGDADAARAAATEAVRAAGSTWEGERHRVATELAWIANELGDVTGAARLLSIAEAPDRRELPFRSPGELARLRATCASVRSTLGTDFQELSASAATSTLAEAASFH